MLFRPALWPSMLRRNKSIIIIAICRIVLIKISKQTHSLESRNKMFYSIRNCLIHRNCKGPYDILLTNLWNLDDTFKSVFNVLSSFICDFYQHHAWNIAITYFPLMKWTITSISDVSGLTGITYSLRFHRMGERKSVERGHHSSQNC